MDINKQLKPKFVRYARSRTQVQPCYSQTHFDIGRRVARQFKPVGCSVLVFLFACLFVFLNCVQELGPFKACMMTFMPPYKKCLSMKMKLTKKTHSLHLAPILQLYPVSQKYIFHTKFVQLLQNLFHLLNDTLLFKKMNVT